MWTCLEYLHIGWASRITLTAYTFIAVCFLDESHSDWVTWNLSVDFIFIFLMTNHIEYFLVCLFITYTVFNNVHNVIRSSHGENK